MKVTGVRSVSGTAWPTFIGRQRWPVVPPPVTTAFVASLSHPVTLCHILERLPRRVHDIATATSVVVDVLGAVVVPDVFATARYELLLHTFPALNAAWLRFVGPELAPSADDVVDNSDGFGDDDDAGDGVGGERDTAASMGRCADDVEYPKSGDESAAVSMECSAGGGEPQNGVGESGHPSLFHGSGSGSGSGSGGDGAAPHPRWCGYFDGTTHVCDECRDRGRRLHVSVCGRLYHDHIRDHDHDTVTMCSGMPGVAAVPGGGDDRRPGVVVVVAFNAALAGDAESWQPTLAAIASSSRPTYVAVTAVSLQQAEEDLAALTTAGLTLDATAAPLKNPFASPLAQRCEDDLTVTVRDNDYVLLAYNSAAAAAVER